MVITVVKSRQSGFTLIELMIAVAIVGILGAIALPIYRGYVISGQVAEATNNLSALRAKMEQYYQDNRTYLSNGTIYSPCDASNSLPTLNGGLKYFQIDCTSNGSWKSTSYTLTATGVTGKPTAGFVYTLDNNNNQTSSTPAGSAWGASTCPNTWKTQKAGC
ncbi:MAG TPA: type IV pilin protein [Burkholderiaceae bacterium]